MLLWATIARRVRSLFHRSQVERELDEELRFHLERQIEANVAKGMGSDEARRAALRAFGGLEQTREACRDQRGVRLLEEIGADVVYGLRVLRKSPSFTAAAVLTLVLGIGANTVVFSVVNGVLLRRLPYPEPDRIVTLWNIYPDSDDRKEEVSPPDFHDWRAQSSSFAHMAAYERFFYVLGGDPTPIRVPGARVSGDFFAVMGVDPILGRPLLPADDHEGVHHVAVLSHRLWTRRFAADPSIVGRDVMLTGRGFTILGVMPAGFRFPYDVDLWTPMAYEPPFDPGLRRSVWLRTVGRLGPGVTLAQAESELAAVARRLEQQYPDTNQGRGVVAIPLHEETVGSIRLPLLVLLGAVGLVLLIACTNLVNLLLARACGRRHEIALRAALGAGRARLARQLVTESTLLSLLGGAGGVLLAGWSLASLRGLDPKSIPRLPEIQLDLPVLVVTFVVSLVAGVVTGIVPALLTTGADLYESIQEGGPRAADGVRRRRLRDALVVAEVALAQVLLVGGALLLQSFLHMRNVDPGFEPAGLMVARLELSSDLYSRRSDRVSFYGEVVARVAALPGVEAAALSTTIPLAEGQLSNDFLIEDRPRPLVPTQYPWAGFDAITPDYFRAMGISLLSGRAFTDADGAEAPPATIINEAMAERYWPGEDPVGRRFRLVSESPIGSAPITIVGVVTNVRQMALNTEARPEFYQPYPQRPWSQCFLLVRSELPPAGLVGPLRREIRSMDPGLALSDLRGMEDHVRASLLSPRLHTALLGAFALLALTLAAVGVFGVVSYSTSQRTRELAVRVILGAQRRDVFRLVAAKGLLPVLLGVGLGLLLALALARVLSSMLFGIAPTDPGTYLAVGALLGAVAVLACFLPSRRAMNVDPLTVLRAE